MRPAENRLLAAERPVPECLARPCVVDDEAWFSVRGLLDEDEVRAHGPGGEEVQALGGVGAGGERNLPELAARAGVDGQQEPCLVPVEAGLRLGTPSRGQEDGLARRAEQLGTVENRSQVLEFAERGVDLSGVPVDRGDGEGIGLFEGVVDGVELLAVRGRAAHEPDLGIGPLGLARRGVQALDAVLPHEEQSVEDERGGEGERVRVAGLYLPEEVPGGFLR